ncbi:hypothetical protein Tco_0102196 [Tanacetum coccineum]
MVSSFPQERRYGGVTGYVRKRRKIHTTNAKRGDWSSSNGTILEEKIFVKFDEFMAMNIEENFESESDTEEPPFEKIFFNTDYKIKTSLEEPPSSLELQPLPDHLEYLFFEEPTFLPVIISS